MFSLIVKFLLSQLHSAVLCHKCRSFYQDELSFFSVSLIISSQSLCPPKLISPGDYSLLTIIPALSSLLSAGLWDHTSCPMFTDQETGPSISDTNSVSLSSQLSAWVDWWNLAASCLMVLSHCYALDPVFDTTTDTITDPGYKDCSLRTCWRWNKDIKMQLSFCSCSVRHLRL